MVTNEADIAERLDAIAFPGMTANFDAAKSAALAVTMLDWREYGTDYAKAMVDLSQALAAAMQERGAPVFADKQGFTSSHQFAVQAKAYGGGQAASKTLRKTGFLACGIGLPIDPVDDDLNGLRIGTPELVRWGVQVGDAERLADLIVRGLTTNSPNDLAAEVVDWRSQFNEMHFVR